ncbi:alpha/beta fold hydrolase [Leptolyngbya ohadii]|uniref:alpha/beta fold hydrolase n=1 Tax=Leptolyngbya ohadii TaxID=1962290 RepID=UPI000B59C68F|nr:alpha/beta fold hydrolase [Leptolyngbya ohadii]
MIINESSSSTEQQPSTQFWQWRGYSIAYQTAGTSGTPVLLIHGLGASCLHWRKNIGILAEQHRVYAIDLIGFGASAKPKPGEAIDYRFETWGAQINDFCGEVIGEGAHLVGNSIGCLVALQAAVNQPEQVKSLALLDCALRLQHERKLKGFRRITFPYVQKLLTYPPIGHFFFSKLAQPQVIRKALLKAYSRQEAVTDELVDILLKPAQDEGAADVFLSFITNSTGPLPEDLLPQISVPVLLAWGKNDPWEPFEQGKALAEFPAVKQFVPLEDIGHCPQDEAPEIINPLLNDWFTQ